MAKIQLPPKKDEQITFDTIGQNGNEKKISAVINKGGSITKQVVTEQNVILKNFNIKILESEIKSINELREKRPRLRGQKRLGISLNDWIIEAIQEKIEYEKGNIKV